MNSFRTVVNIKTAENKISHKSNVMLLGSCFTENIGNKLGDRCFPILQNPFGIVYNPQSICEQIVQLIYNISIEEHELFHQNEEWHSYQFHSRFSRTDKNEALKVMNESMEKGHKFLKEADYLIITLGTSKVYALFENHAIVANCHKTPNNKFDHTILEAAQIVKLFETTFNHLQKFNPNIKIVFTVSPIRHWKDGAIENQLSKSTLFVALHQLINKFENTSYFPAYEIMMDDLRDYRFYADDMLHPTTLAIDYIWNKFSECFFADDTKKLNKEIEGLNAAKNHRPYNSNSEAYKNFIEQNIGILQNIRDMHPYLDLNLLENCFKRN